MSMEVKCTIDIKEQESNNMYMYDYSKQKSTSELKRSVCNSVQQRSESQILLAEYGLHI